ncbi:hypothetical protein [Rummeliibacillus suwonensis]|uniref:hypothetical protein n=1 Tax=Rummeliibacillus suwonensis TaxID=1306154 RepID=UPI001AAF9A73|nr:hypothetical protein [Rummeliibacillus suwonensis]MBO2535392.1 hypothetical protein [Rummeliibacillus suwonensis]
MHPIGSDQQDVGPSGVATGRGAFDLSSSPSMVDEKTPLMKVSLYRFTFLESNQVYVAFSTLDLE